MLSLWWVLVCFLCFFFFCFGFKGKTLYSKINLNYILENKLYIWKKLEILALFSNTLGGGSCNSVSTCSPKQFLIWIILTSFKYRFLNALNPLMTTASVLMKAPGPPSDPTLTAFTDPAAVERKTSSIAALRLKAKEHSAQIPQLNLISSLTNTNKELC